MINRLFKFSAPTSLCCVLFGSSFMIYSSFPGLRKDEETNKNEFEKPLVETIAIETPYEEDLTTIKYDAKYQEIMQNYDYFHDQEYKIQNLTEAEKAEVDEIENLYSEYSEIINDFDKELNISNKKSVLTTNLTIDIGDNIIRFYDIKNNPLLSPTKNFDIITAVEQGRNAEKYFYKIKLNFSNVWKTISGTKEFVNKWGNEITEANKKLFNKVLEHKLKNKSKLDKEIIDRYTKYKEYIKKENDIADSNDFLEMLWWMWINVKKRHDDQTPKLFEPAITNYSNWHIESNGKQYGYFLKYLYHFWFQENPDNKILKDEYLNAEFAKIDKLTINKFKDLDVISNQIDTTISEWIINYLSNSANEQEWKTEEFKNAKDEDAIKNLMKNQ